MYQSVSERVLVQAKQLINRGRWRQWAATHRCWQISSLPPLIPSSPGPEGRIQHFGGFPPSLPRQGQRWPTRMQLQRPSWRACSQSQRPTWLRRSLGQPVHKNYFLVQAKLSVILPILDPGQRVACMAYSYLGNGKHHLIKMMYILTIFSNLHPLHIQICQNGGLLRVDFHICPWPTRF